MIQHGSSYNILEKINCNSGEAVVILNCADKLDRIREKIRDNLHIAHDKASKTYNMRTRPSKFQRGHVVFRKNHILSSLTKRIDRKSVV